MSLLPLLVGLSLGAPAEEVPHRPPPEDVIAACDKALETKDEAGLQTCVEAWVRSDPKNPDTDWYAFHLAIVQGRAYAAESARNRALARGLDEERVQILKRAGLPPNPLLALQRWFIAAVLGAGLAGMVWARYRHMAERDITESAEADREG